MKFVLLLCAVVIGYGSCENKLQIVLPTASTKKLMEVTPVCIKKSTVSPDILMQLKEKTTKYDEAFEKFVECAFASLGLSDDKGLLVPVKVQDFTGMPDNKELKEIIQDCNKEVKSTDKSTGGILYKCCANKIEVRYNF